MFDTNQKGQRSLGDRKWVVWVLWSSQNTDYQERFPRPRIREGETGEILWPPCFEQTGLGVWGGQCSQIMQGRVPRGKLCRELRRPAESLSLVFSWVLSACLWGNHLRLRKGCPIQMRRSNLQSSHKTGKAFHPHQSENLITHGTFCRVDRRVSPRYWVELD